MDRNLLAVVRESKLFILPILPRLAPRSLVLDEHHMVKDLPCYEVARIMDSKAYQEGKLRQAPTTSCTTSSSTIRPLANKKSPVI